MLIDLPNSAVGIDTTFRSAIHAPYFDKPQSPYVSYTLYKHKGAMRAEIPIAEARVTDIEAMDANWDGYGAIKISSETAKNTKNIIANLCAFTPIPDITPNPNGTVSLEWETTEGFAHLEIGQTKYSFYIKLRSGKAILADGSTKKIEANIGKLIAEMLYPSRGSETITKITFLSNDVRTAY